MYTNPKTSLEVILYPIMRTLNNNKFNEAMDNKDFDYATFFVKQKFLILIRIKYESKDDYKLLFKKYFEEIDNEEIKLLFKKVEDCYEKVNNHTGHTTLTKEELLILFNHISSLEQNLINEKIVQ